ncbi:MAG: (Fe-S)-binding protein [Desulfobacterales bacterium]|nr:(Fe-S)-binding protein [Desulfobacterales bacterium]
MIMNQINNPNTSVIDQLDIELQEMSEKCIECKLCVKQCAFLKKYGTPKKIADSWPVQKNITNEMPFECSLCSLCTAVCPVDIDPKQMFLEMRRYAVATGSMDFTKQKLLLNFEKRGTSKRYSFYGLPQGCDTILFPGCALSGSRSQRVMQLYEHLQKKIPHLGIVLDCCTKPSHDLGRSDYFEAMFSEMHRYLLDLGIKTVLVACPSCFAVFNKYAEGLDTKNVYDILAGEAWPPDSNISSMVVTIQDSCVARFEEDMQFSVRKLIRAQEIPFEEMKHHGKKTLCCGEGGGAHFVAPDLAGQWGEIRRTEGNGKRIITYCAGCANFLGKIGPTAHLLDLLFDPAATLNGKAKVARSPLTYINRLLLKRRFRKKRQYANTRERNLSFKI